MNYFINIFESWQPFAVDWSACLIKAVLLEMKIELEKNTS